MFKKIIGILIKIFVNDLNWKLVSVGTAFLLWFIGMNVDNPITIKSYERKLVLFNMSFMESNDVVLLNRNELLSLDINLGVRANRNNLIELDNRPSNLTAYISINEIDFERVKQSDSPVTINAIVHANVIQNYEVVNRWPTTVDLILDNVSYIELPVQVVAIGEVADGYEMQFASSDILRVGISGAKSIIDSIAGVRVEIDMEGANSTVSKSGKIIVNDQNGNDITDKLYLSDNEAMAVIPVYKIKNIGLTRTATGSPAINYTLTNIQLDPDNIDVVGNEETLLELDTILISDINIANRSDSFTMSFDIRQYLPEGVYLRRGESSIVDAFITIEEFAIYSFSIPRHQITLIGLFHLPYQIVGTDALNIRLRGPESALKNINILTLYPRINLYGYSEGEHSVLLSLTLPANVILLDGPVTIDVVILPNINDHNEDETEN